MRVCQLCSVCNIQKVCVLCIGIKYTLPLVKQFKLGNLDAKRDWGHAKDFVEVRMLYLYFVFK